MNVRNDGFQGVVAPAYTGPVGNVGFGGVQGTGVVSGGFVPAPAAYAAAGSFAAVAAPVSYAPTQTTSPVVHPTQYSVNRNVFKHVVPHVHPSHNHTVNDHVYQHQHYFKNTCSVSNRCCSQHVVCGPLPPRPCGWC
ncbi:MAG: CotD family spore coat protein [Bacillus sp. (in: firmicutes)]